MKRRDFLVGAASVVGASTVGFAQAPAQAPAGGRAGAPGRGGGGGRGGPANVAPEKLARVSLMTLNFGSYMIQTGRGNADPNAAPPAPNPERTLTVMDLAKMYVDMYGVHNIEYQLGDVRRAETDPSFIADLKAKHAELNMTMTQVNLEIGAAEGMTADAAGRQKGLDHIKQWVDIASQLGCKRLMLNQNQGALTKDRKADAVAYMKTAADMGRPKGVMISVETRGAGQPSIMVDGKPVVQDLGMKPWEFMADIIEAAGANSNVDIGNVGANNQEELHACIKRWYPTSSGNMHIKSNPNWSITKAIEFTEGLGYRGRYSLEVSRHEAIRIVYNEILATVKNTIDPKW